MLAFQLGSGAALSAIIPDSLHRATFHGFLALGFLIGAFRLFFHIRVAPVIIPCKILRRGFTTQVAIDALIVDVVLARHVFRVSVRNISHNSNCPYQTSLAARMANIKLHLCEKPKSSPPSAPLPNHPRSSANSSTPA